MTDLQIIARCEQLIGQHLRLENEYLTGDRVFVYDPAMQAGGEGELTWDESEEVGTSMMDSLRAEIAWRKARIVAASKAKSITDRRLVGLIVLRREDADLARLVAEAARLQPEVA